jgi:hypothetical protein
MTTGAGALGADRAGADCGADCGADGATDGLDSTDGAEVVGSEAELLLGANGLAPPSEETSSAGARSEVWIVNIWVMNYSNEDVLSCPSWPDC